MGNGSEVRLMLPRSTIWALILLVAPVPLLCAGLWISQAILPSANSALTIQRVGWMYAIIFGASWCLAAYLITHWQRRYLATTLLLTGVGTTFVVVGLLALSPIGLGGELLLVLNGGLLLTLIAGGVAFARRRPA
jgi:hypothetical protein